MNRYRDTDRAQLEERWLSWYIFFMYDLIPKFLIKLEEELQFYADTNKEFLHWLKILLMEI